MALFALLVVAKPIEAKKPPAFAVAPISYHEYRFESVYERKERREKEAEIIYEGPEILSFQT